MDSSAYAEMAVVLLANDTTKFLGVSAAEWIAAAVAAVCFGLILYVYDKIMSKTRHDARRLPVLVLHLARVAMRSDDWHLMYNSVWMPELLLRFHLNETTRWRRTLQYWECVAYSVSLVLSAARNAREMSGPRSWVPGPQQLRLAAIVTLTSGITVGITFMITGRLSSAHQLMLGGLLGVAFAVLCRLIMTAARARRRS